jgi:hypothetical protein
MVPRRRRVALALGLTLSAAVGWEVGEFLYWHEPSKFPTVEAYLLDTVVDVVLVQASATLGALEVVTWRRG